MWIYIVFKGNVYPGSAGQELIRRSNIFYRIKPLTIQKFPAISKFYCMYIKDRKCRVPLTLKGSHSECYMGALKLQIGCTWCANLFVHHHSSEWIFTHKNCKNFTLIFISRKCELEPSSIAVGCVSDCRCSGDKFDSQPGHITFAEIDHEIFSMAILTVPLIQEGQLPVSGKSLWARYWLAA